MYLFVLEGPHNGSDDYSLPWLDLVKSYSGIPTFQRALLSDLLHV